MQNYNISDAILKKTKNEDEEKDDNVTKTENLKNKSLNEVLFDLDQIKSQYSSKDYVDAPDTLELDKINKPNKSDEDLLNIAKSSLEKKYSANKENTSRFGSG